MAHNWKHTIMWADGVMVDTREADKAVRQLAKEKRAWRKMWEAALADCETALDAKRTATARIEQLEAELAMCRTTMADCADTTNELRERERVLLEALGYSVPGECIVSTMRVAATALDSYGAPWVENTYAERLRRLSEKLESALRSTEGGEEGEGDEKEV